MRCCVLDLFNLMLVNGYLAKLMANEAAKNFVDEQGPGILEF